MLVKDSIKSTLKTMDASEYGGAPLIGLNGLVVKTHGSAKAKEGKEFNSSMRDIFKKQY